MIGGTSNNVHSKIMLELSLFLFICLISMMLGGLLTPFIAQTMGISDFQTFLSTLSETSSATERTQVKVVLLITQSLSFILPSLLFAYLVHKNKLFQFLKLKSFPTSSFIFMGCLLILTAFPAAQLLMKLNQLIDLSGAAADLEAKASTLTQALLVMNSPQEFMFTLFVVALIPAVGEELVFRGIIQNYLSKINLHTAIWTTAFLFSAFHLQFEGFLPRFLLGAILGYLLYWSGSLWLPIIGHFLFNGLQITGVYILQLQGETVDLKATDQLPWVFMIISTIMMLGLAYWLNKSKQNLSSHEA